VNDDFSAQAAKANWDARYEGSDYVWKVTPNRFVEQHLADLTPGSAIDLGGGEGRNAVWLATLGWRVTVVDVSPVGLAKAHRLAEETSAKGTPVEVATVEADATTWSPPDPVDLVVLSYLQLPTELRVPLLERVGSWLAPGGTVFVVAHDRSNLEHGHGGPPYPDVLYDATEAEAAFRDSGLVIEHAAVEQRPVPLAEPPGTTATALDTVVRAVRP
jgi:SAM-dependent methyltransferase